MEFNFTEAQYDAMVAAERIFEFAVIAFALWRGDRTVRAMGAVFLFSAVGAIVAELASTQASPTVYYLLVDGLALLAILAVAARDRRPWALWVTAFKLMVVATHTMYLVDQRIGPLAYVTAANTWLLLADGALLRGALEAARARSRDATA